MQIVDILKQNDSGVAFEFFPPKTATGKNSFVNIISALKAYKPLYVSVTYGAGGSSQEQTKETVSALLREKKLVVMPHLTCIGADKQSIKMLLNRYKQSGIENIMALRGDLPQGAKNSAASQQDFSYARDLVIFIKKYGHFCIGVAVYPEGHIETSSLEEDLEYTKQKIDTGAEFAVTQMFFDNSFYFALLERIKRKGITIPVLPGILPLTDIVKVKQFTSICRTTIPKKIQDSMARYTHSPLEMEKAGLDFTIEQCRDLIKNGVKRLHFFTLNKPGVIEKVISAL